MRFLYLALFFLFITSNVLSQGLEIHKSWIVKMSEEAFEQRHTMDLGDGVDHFNLISNRFQLLEIVTTHAVNESEMANIISELAYMHYYPNAKVSPRTRTPNDPLYGDQWNMDIINMPEVWESTTGGTTPSGKDIVIAVIDDGFEIDHVDLVDNLWTNEAEIPLNGIDDDGNGVIDDYRGYHIDTNNDDLPARSHGSRVAGIIGANGDNGTGVSGVNWETKLMLIGGVDLISEIMRSMEYIIDMKEMYIQTNGQRGANILVNNLSLGKERVFPEEFPDWCAFYEAAGELGILSVGATANELFNVDVEGDLPSVCDSDYLIVVTNTDIEDIKVIESAVGPIHVDIGAPGEFVLSTSTDNGFADIRGSSGSAPHVTGLAAILFGACSKLELLSQDNPGQAALIVKQAIIESAVPREGLDLTVSGGRLDAFAAYENILEFCAGDFSDAITVDNIFQNGSNVTLSYSTNNLSELSLIHI